MIKDVVVARVALSNPYPRQHGGRFGFGTGEHAADSARHPRMSVEHGHEAYTGQAFAQAHFSATSGQPLGGRGLAAERALQHIRRNGQGNAAVEARLDHIAQSHVPTMHERAALHDLHALYRNRVKKAKALDEHPDTKARLQREMEVIKAYGARHGLDVTTNGTHLDSTAQEELGHVMRSHIAAEQQQRVAQGLQHEPGDAASRLAHDSALHPENVDGMPIGGAGLRAERALSHIAAEVDRQGGVDAATQTQINKLRDVAAGHRPNRDDLHELYALHAIYQHELTNQQLPAASRARLERESAIIKTYVSRHGRWGSQGAREVEKTFVRGKHGVHSPARGPDEHLPRHTDAESFAHIQQQVQRGLRREGHTPQLSERNAGMRDISAVYNRPIQLAEPGADGKRRSWIMYLPLGTFHHPEYGTLRFNRALLDEVKRHFDEEVRGIEIALDVDHTASKGNSAAPGWMEQMAYREAAEDAPAGLWALIRWTELGVDLLGKEIYKYFSPEFGKHLNELTGKKIDNVPIGGALTNRPFLKSMRPIQLSERDKRKKLERDLQHSEQRAGARRGTTMPGTKQEDLERDADLDELLFDDMGDEYDDAEDELDGGADDAEEGDEDETPAPKAKGKAKAKPAAKKMSEIRGLPKLELAEKYAMLEQRMARMDAERAVTKQLTAWQNGQFSFSEQTKKGAKGSFALSPRFERAYAAVMLSDDIVTLDETTRGHLGKVIELALSNALVRTDRVGNSFDSNRPRAVAGRKGAPSDTIALEEKAQELAAAAGKDFLALEFSERNRFYDQAARVISYGKHTDDE